MCHMQQATYMCVMTIHQVTNRINKCITLMFDTMSNKIHAYERFSCFTLCSNLALSSSIKSNFVSHVDASS
jgi:hypothetical protein